MLKQLTLLILMVSLSLGAWAVSIYEIQFTSTSGSDGTYPSRYIGKNVSIEGVVTATNYKNGGYFISETLNGPWRGVYVLDRNASVNTGDIVRITGSVSETFGMTCLQDISQTRVLSSNNPLPQPVLITTGQLSRADEAEAYEGVYARLLNTTSTGSKNYRGKMQVTDGSGTCFVLSDLFSPIGTIKTTTSSSHFTSITGVVIYGFSEFALGPIATTDMIIQQPKFIQNRSWGKIKSIYK